MKNYILRNISIVVLSVATILSVSVSSSFAASVANANGFSISPVVNEITVNKGQSQSIPITLENPTSVTTVAKPVVNNFEASSDESGSPKLILNQTPIPENNFIPLVKPIPDTTIAANQSVTINVVISVPTNAASGGYYGVIRFVPTFNGNPGNVGLTASVGSLFLVTVPGNLVEKLSLVQLSAAVNGHTSSFFTSGNISVITRLKNDGNIHVAPFGSIQIRNMYGKTVMTQSFNKEGGNVLPDSIRRFTNNTPSYKWFGKYTIITNIGYGNSGNNLITAKSTFWYFPVWAIILFFILIILLVALIYWIVHSIRSRRFRKSMR